MPRGHAAPRRRRGFTLIELLTVIAIIAILAAILLPVFAVVREKSRQGGCQSQIQHIIQGWNMYKDDWRVYPEALFGLSRDGVNIEYRLYPNYVTDRKTFNCPNSWIKLPRTEGDPIPLVDAVNRTTGATTPYQLANFSSYDFQYRPNNPTSTGRELHYMLKWTGLAAGLTDEPRQLIYRDPPDSTVVTWCLYHSNLDQAGNPARQQMALVGFKSGRVQTIPADRVADWPASCTSPAAGTLPTGCPWQVSPKP